MNELVVNKNQKKYSNIIFKVLLFTGIFIGVLLLLCSNVNLKDEAAVSYSVWNNKNLQNYEYEIKWEYFYLPPDQLGPFFVRVLNGKVDSVWYNFEEAFVEKGKEIQYSVYNEYHINSIFEDILKKKKMAYKSFEIDFDDSLAYPHKYRIIYDNDLGNNHPEWFFLRNFKILKDK